MDGIYADSGCPSDPSPNRHDINLGVLESLGVSLPGRGIPLLGEQGLLHLGEVGALGAYSSSPNPYESTSSVGLVGADGSLNLGDGDDYGYATVNLTQALGSLGADTIEGVEVGEDGSINVEWQVPSDMGPGG